MDISFQTNEGTFNYRACGIVIEDGKILAMRDERFTMREQKHTHVFEWLALDRLQGEYFYPLFLKKDIFHLPDALTIRTENE